MPLTPGQTHSFHEILGPLGAAGMGEVYRAKDTRIEREAAGGKLVVLLGWASELDGR